MWLRFLYLFNPLKKESIYDGHITLNEYPYLDSKEELRKPSLPECNTFTATKYYILNTIWLLTKIINTETLVYNSEQKTQINHVMSPQSGQIVTLNSQDSMIFRHQNHIVSWSSSFDQPIIMIEHILAVRLHYSVRLWFIVSVISFRWTTFCRILRGSIKIYHLTLKPVLPKAYYAAKTKRFDRSIIIR